MGWKEQMDHRGTTVRRGQQGDGFDQPLEGTVQRPDHDPVARFRYDALTGTWWWSDQMLAVFGLPVEEAAPSLQVLLDHVHPEDRAAVGRTTEQALRDGAPFSSRHRILTEHGSLRHVVAMGEGVSANGTVIALRGYLIDLTDGFREVVQQETADGIARSVANRAAIEQAKGALMATYGITSDEAFQALRAYSNHTNVKLNVLAAYVVAELVNPALAHLRPQEKLGEILAAVTDSPHLLETALGSGA
jgi:hypothetical protein